jgi:hypothetical protein
MFAHAYQGRVGIESSAADFELFFSDLLASEDDFVLQRGSSALAGYTLDFAKAAPRLLAYKEVRYHEILPRMMALVPSLKLVGIVRDPREVIASWVGAPREFRAEWDLLAEWRDAPSKNLGQPGSWYGFERWKALAALLGQLAERFPARTRILRYEDLVADPAREADALFAWCGLAPGEQTRRFLSRSRTEDDGHAYGVLRSAARLARPLAERLPAGISDAICRDLEGTPLARYLASQ